MFSAARSVRSFPLRRLVLCAVLPLAVGCAGKQTGVEQLEVQRLVDQVTAQVSASVAGVDARQSLDDADRFEPAVHQSGAGHSATQQITTTQDPALIGALERIAGWVSALGGAGLGAFVLVMLHLSGRLGALGRELTGLREDTQSTTAAVQRVPSDTARELALLGLGGRDAPASLSLPVGGPARIHAAT